MTAEVGKVKKLEKEVGKVKKLEKEVGKKHRKVT